jgi:hypothetical protein
MPSEDGLPSARQWSKKLQVVSGQAVLGVSGHDGLAQEMALALERSLSEPEKRDISEGMLREKLREALAAPIQRTVAIHRTLQGLPGFGITSNEFVVSQSLLGIPFHNVLRLFKLDPECSLTEITPDLAWSVIGSARSTAEPFMSFLSKVLWESGRPNVAQAELAAFWTLKQAIEYNPGGLSYPIQLTVMIRSEGGSIDIIERGDREMDVMRQVVDEGETAFRRNFHVLPSGQVKVRGREAVADVTTRKRVPEVRLTLDRPRKEQAKKAAEESSE